MKFIDWLGSTKPPLVNLMVVASAWAFVIAITAAFLVFLFNAPVTTLIVTALIGVIIYQWWSNLDAKTRELEAQNEELRVRRAHWVNSTD